MRNFFIPVCILIYLFSGCVKKKNFHDEPNLMIGVKVYLIERELNTLFKEWEELGINTVFASPSLFNDEFKVLAKKYDIETFIILPVFYDPDALQAIPDLYAVTDNGEKAIEEWVEFVCPSREDYRDQKVEYIKTLIWELDPDGISLDFIRFFCFWEKVYPDRNPNSIPNTCFCSSCLKEFQSEEKISLPDSLKEIPEIAWWIESYHSSEWIRWKCNQITGMVSEIVQEAKKMKPGIKVNIHVVPWRKDDFNNAIKRIVAQDFSALANYTDIISPMTYSHMVKRKPAWINSVVMDIADQADCRIIPSIQVNEAYITETLTTEEFEQSLMEALKPPSSGVFFWSWEQLEERPEKKEILKKVLSF